MMNENAWKRRFSSSEGKYIVAFDNDRWRHIILHQNVLDIVGKIDT